METISVCRKEAFYSSMATSLTHLPTAAHTHVRRTRHPCRLNSTGTTLRLNPRIRTINANKCYVFNYITYAKT